MALCTGRVARLVPVVGRLTAVAATPLAPALWRAASTSIDASTIQGRHFDSLFSYSASEIETLLDLAAALKKGMRGRAVVYQPLVGRDSLLDECLF